MLATLTGKLFSDPRWIFELKFDGECLAFRDGDRVRLSSRNRQPLNATYPELIGALAVEKHVRAVTRGDRQARRFPLRGGAALTELAEIQVRARSKSS